MEEFISIVFNLVNTPLFSIGQTQVTLGNIVLAVFIFFISFIVSAFIRRIIKSRLSKQLKFSKGMTYAVNRIVHYLIITLGVIIAAQFLGINLDSFAIAFGFVGVGIGFGLQSLTANFISGIIMLIEQPVSVGDMVSIENQVGTVSKVQMRATLINTLDNISIIVPNSKFIDNQVINWSHGDTRVRLHCPVGVSYGSDVPLVRNTLLQVAKEHPDVLKRPEPEVLFLKFNDSSLDFDLLIWIDDPEKQFIVKSQINYAIDEAFRKNNIKIPFPQLDMHFFSDKRDIPVTFNKIPT
jgi:small-conductance mechanosensitive channel